MGRAVGADGATVVGACEGVAVGDVVGTRVGAPVGWAVGEDGATVVGNCDGAAVGEAVGDVGAVGAREGDDVVGCNVGPNVVIHGPTCEGGTQQVNMLSLYIMLTMH